MLDVIYEDNHLLVVNKPAGIPTQPNDNQEDSLEVRAKHYLKEKYQKPGNVFIGVVHRIDKPVSGIVVFAKTSKALSRLNETIREKKSHKTYYAVLESIPSPEEGTLEHYLVHDEYRATVSSRAHSAAKLARLHYHILKQVKYGCVVEIDLETGRYHQIRAQFAAIGCPVLGDFKYGAQTSLAQHAIALHHGKLEIPHPISKETMVFKAEAPSYLQLDNP